MGAAIGFWLTPDNPAAIIACTCASLAPDLVMGPQMLWDWHRRRQALTQQPRWLITLKEISHSVLIWCLPAFITAIYAQEMAEALAWVTMPDPLTRHEWQLIGLMMSIGGITHIIFDQFTHGRGDTAMAQDDPRTMIWPLRINLQPVLGILEYRLKTGSFMPTWWETIIDMMFLLYLQYIMSVAWIRMLTSQI